jgi:site-specific DNA-methyltransferase (adenine-specific)
MGFPLVKKRKVIGLPIMFQNSCQMKQSQESAKQWQGWGTALKPAHEPMVLARKPLIGTVAANVLTYGTGGLNIDGSRVGNEVITNNINDFSNQHGNKFGNGEPIAKLGESQVVGRWPANVIHDGSDEVVALFPVVKTGSIKPHQQNSESESFGLKGKFITGSHSGDSGSAARFFYCAKASKRDRNEGLDGFEAKNNGKMMRNANNTSEEPSVGFERFATEPSANHHPTVKPTDLMRYLCRLITPPNGTVLDPFMGSGSTGKAAMYEGFKFIGIEMTDEYLPIAKARIEFAVSDNEGFLL